MARSNHQRGRHRLPDADNTARGQLTDVLKQLNAVIHRLPAAEDALAAYEQRPGRDFALDEVQRSLSALHESLQMAYLQVESAAVVVDKDQPVDVAYGNGKPWGGPQRPHYVLGLADRAANGTARATTSYRRRLRDGQLAESMDPTCPHTRYGQPCTSERVNRADGTRAAACWPHLTPEQKQEISVERDKAITANACSECGAAAGEKCVRNGKPASIHQRRLHAPQGASS